MRPMDWTLDIDSIYLLNIGDVRDYLKKKCIASGKLIKISELVSYPLCITELLAYSSQSLIW